MRFKIIRFFFAAIAGCVFSACSLAHTMKTVETAPKGQARNTIGATAWLTRNEAFYQDDESTSKKRIWVVAPLYNLRYGLSDWIEAGVSVDGYWPGAGGKIRLNRWAAVDANVKLRLPVWEDEPRAAPFFDAALILGNAKYSGGLKLLSKGEAPGSAGRGEPDAVLFYGFKHLMFMPEVAFMTRHREFSFGLGLLF